MKALLIIWTIVSFSGHSSAVSQTSTPMTTIEACQEAKRTVEKMYFRRDSEYIEVSVTAVCSPL